MERLHLLPAGLGHAPRVTLAVLLSALLVPVGSGLAQDPPQKDGLFISVPNPITSEAVQQIKQKVTDALEGTKKRNITTIVFDFNPLGLPNSTSDFGPCNSLAKFIRQLQLGQIKPAWPHITTVAFVQHEATRHTVLPVLACDQVIMSGEQDKDLRIYKARLGGVTRDLEGVLDETERTAYRNIAKRYPSPDVIQRMIDPELPLRFAKTKQGERYLSPDSVKEWEAKGDLISVEPGAPPGLQAGQNLFDPDRAVELKLARTTYNSRAELATALQLPRQSLVEDWLAGRTKVAWVIEVRGPIDAGKVSSLRRRINRAVGLDANYIILHLDSEGGETRDVASLANEIRTMKDNSGTVPVKFVAWVPPARSLGAATFLALACSEIVMGTDAALSDFNYLSDEEHAETRRRAAEMIAPLAREQGYPPLLFQATLEPDLTVVRVKAKNNPSHEQLITEQDFERDQQSAKPRWNSFGRLVPGDGGGLKVTANLAREWRVAQATDIDTLDALYAWSGLSADTQRIRVARDDWLDQIAEFFREPWVRFLLIMLGIIGLILELKMPGTTFPGVMSAVCFVLFFWAYSFVGEFTFLAVLLFILGLVLIAVEIFVLPGLGVTGITGLLLVIVSLVLVTLERMPETSQDWVNLGTTLITFALSMAAALVGAFMLAWYLPSIPYANRLILKPPTDDPEAEDVPNAVSTYAGLLGAIGIAATPLRPAGKAQFGEDYLDVIAEGDYVNLGSRVQVIEIEGNRIVVKEV
jgi:membrane-bound ClpP family serine protease